MMPQSLTALPDRTVEAGDVDQRQPNTVGLRERLVELLQRGRRARLVALTPQNWLNSSRFRWLRSTARITDMAFILPPFDFGSSTHSGMPRKMPRSSVSGLPTLMP